MAWGAGLHDGVVAAAMDARRSQVYCAAFAMEGGAPRRLLPDAAISVAEFGAALAGLAGPVTLYGDGAQLCFDALSASVPALRLAPEHLRQQRAAGVALAAWERLRQGAAADAASLSPVYLRLSQAERERLAKENMRGA